MNFEKYVLKEIENHPSVQPVDIVKLCYQASFGAEHMLSDLNTAKKYFEMEYAATDSENIPICEYISDDVCRINIGGWKAAGFPDDKLFEMFVASAKVNEDGETLFGEYLREAEKVITESGVFSLTIWKDFFNGYMKTGGAVHHSEEYRKNEKPAYRIVSSQLFKRFMHETANGTII